MTEENLAALFQLWKVHCDLNPEWFLSHEETDALGPPTYGELCARYFLKLQAELAAM